MNAKDDKSTVAQMIGGSAKSPKPITRRFRNRSRTSMTIDNPAKRSSPYSKALVPNKSNTMVSPIWRRVPSQSKQTLKISAIYAEKKHHIMSARYHRSPCIALRFIKSLTISPSGAAALSLGPGDHPCLDDRTQNLRPQAHTACGRPYCCSVPERDKGTFHH